MARARAAGSFGSTSTARFQAAWAALLSPDFDSASPSVTQAAADLGSSAVAFRA